MAYINQQPFVTSNIIGATSLDQLKENIDALDITLDDALINEVEKIHNEHTYPAP